MPRNRTTKEPVMSPKSTAWETHHQRSAALRDVLATLDAGTTELPWNDGLERVFTDRAGLLVALHDHWSRHLAARLDLALELHDIPEASVAEAWAAVAAQLPGVRRVLEQYAAHPALALSRARADRMVAVAAGVAALDDPLAVAAARGAAFLERARTEDALVVPARRDGWLRERLSFRLLKASA
jgi:hypothetical protein